MNEDNENIEFYVENDSRKQTKSNLDSNVLSVNFSPRAAVDSPQERFFASPQNQMSLKLIHEPAKSVVATSSAVTRDFFQSKPNDSPVTPGFLKPPGMSSPDKIKDRIQNFTNNTESKENQDYYMRD